VLRRVVDTSFDRTTATSMNQEFFPEEISRISSIPIVR